MDATALRTLQAPLKARYEEAPATAQMTLKATGSLDGDEITCKVETARAVVETGLHPAAGGDGLAVCSGDMLLEALAACAGVTLKAVATALDIPLKGGTVRAEGDLDFRGALGVDRDAAVGFSGVRLYFDIETDATDEQEQRLIELTERYCIVYQTLTNTPELGLEVSRLAPGAPRQKTGIEGAEAVESAIEERIQSLRFAASHAL